MGTYTVAETNRFVEQFFENNVISTYTSKWEPVTVEEMKVFNGLIVFLMGIIYSKPYVPMYWSQDGLYSTLIFSQIMSRTRFNLLMKVLHFNNNEDPDFDPEDEERDCLHKLRPLIDIFRDRSKSVYTPGKNLSVDESFGFVQRSFEVQTIY